MLKLTAYLCILGYLLTSAFAQQQLFYPLPQTAPKPASSNPWGLKPLSKPSATKPAAQPAQQYRPPYYPPPPPTYLPSQLNPNAGTNQNFGQNYNPQNYNPQNYNPQNYAKPSPSPPASTSDTWGSWKNNGGAFRFSPGVDFSTTYGDVVVAINSMGTAKVKTIGPTGTSSWVTLAQALSTDAVESRPAVIVNSGKFQVFVITASGTLKWLSTLGTLPLSQMTTGVWAAGGGSYVNDPAGVLLGNNYYVLVIDRATRNIVYGVIDSSNNVITPSPNNLDATKTFTFSPAAATYMNNGVNRLVVAGVTYDGTLNIYDSTVGTAPALVASTFSPTDVSCIDSPQAVGLGDHVEVYCRGKDMQFYCVTIMQGGVGDTRILPEADLPDVFKPVFNSMTNTVTVYSKSPAGRVVSKPFQNYSPVSYWK